jgi:DNA-binding NarL/FixJ family response regulator
MEQPRAIRVVIVDDHAAVRRILRFGLLDMHDIEVVGEAGDGEEALRVCDDLHPDMVLLDLRLPGTDSIATLRALLRMEPVPQVLVHTADYEGRLIPEALAAGACGYVLKSGLAEFVTAIRDAHASQEGERIAGHLLERELDG